VKLARALVFLTLACPVVFLTLAGPFASGVRGGSPERVAAPADPNAGSSEGSPPTAAEAGVWTSVLAAVNGLERVAEARATDPNDALARDYPLYGIAFHFMTQVYTAPDQRAEVLGYLRRGAMLRLSRGLRGTGCEGSWHVVSSGGYVCAGRGVMVGTEPQSYPAAAAARVYEPLPYDYAKLKDKDTALYTKLPSPDLVKEAADMVALARLRGREPMLASQRPLRPAKPVKGKPKPKPGPPVQYLPEVVRAMLQPGFYVSLDSATAPDESGFWRTVRGDFVRLPSGDRVAISARHGTVLPAAPRGPIALVTLANAALYTRDALKGELIQQGVFRPHEALELNPEVISRGAGKYRVTFDGRIVAESALRYLPEIERPKIIPNSARWVAVSLERQTLVAYEGMRPVYATLVSTGKKGFETPTGVFRIQSKHVSTLMDGQVNDEAYSIEDVPWVMYFTGSVALHGAFWHERFGQVRSHGCVNLAPLDAHWLFDWAGPQLPSGFHGVLSTADQPGTFVVVAP
jgi:hypothetical protein